MYLCANQNKTEMKNIVSDTTYSGYVIIFNQPDSNGIVILKESVNINNFDKMKSVGKIVDYIVDDIGIIIFIKPS